MPICPYARVHDDLDTNEPPEGFVKLRGGRAWLTGECGVVAGRVNAYGSFAGVCCGEVCVCV
ncbi:MAG: hypothetical protein ACK52L_05700, partial [Pirellula sp.]